MATNKQQQPAENEQTVGQAVSSVEDFLKNNGKTIVYIVIAVLVVVAAFLAYNRYVAAPKVQEALGQSFVAEQYFAKGEFEKALNGDGNSLGFIDVIDQYGNRAGDIAYFYAGVSQLQLNNFDEAVKYLSKYNGKDNIIAGRAQCCLGDAYVGKGELDNALACYRKAIKTTGENVFAAQYMLKAGIVYEELGQPNKAYALYEEISVKYPQSPEAVDIDKYIYRVKNNN